jgi:hypothetical protein
MLYPAHNRRSVIPLPTILLRSLSMCQAGAAKFTPRPFEAVFRPESMVMPFLAVIVLTTAAVLLSANADHQLNLGVA